MTRRKWASLPWDVAGAMYLDAERSPAAVAAYMKQRQAYWKRYDRLMKIGVTAGVVTPFLLLGFGGWTGRIDWRQCAALAVMFAGVCAFASVATWFKTRDMR
jgi:hypothetical protein